MLAKTPAASGSSPALLLERLLGPGPCGSALELPDLRAGLRLWSRLSVPRRALDVVGAGALLVLTAPILALTAIAIKLDSPGPVLYRQRRLGQNDKPFMMNKLRSMRQGRVEVEGLHSRRTTTTASRASAISSGGRDWTSFQLWNVLVAAT
ncbi:MAG: sugar transferase [Myxococcota bacterium]